MTTLEDGIGEMSAKKHVQTWPIGRGEGRDINKLRPK